MQSTTSFSRFLIKASRTLAPAVCVVGLLAVPFSAALAQSSGTIIDRPLTQEDVENILIRGLQQPELETGQSDADRLVRKLTFKAAPEEPSTTKPAPQQQKPKQKQAYRPAKCPAIQTNVDDQIGQPLSVMLNFENGSDLISNDGAEQLDVIGRTLAANEGVRVLIAGGASTPGSCDANLELSNRRALAARNYLIQAFGIDGGRLGAIGFGETRLLADISGDHRFNRRVEFFRINP